MASSLSAILRSYVTFTTLLTLLFLAYAGYTLRTLADVAAPPPPSLRDASGRLLPLVGPLWASAPRGLSLSLRLAVAGGGSSPPPPVTMLEVHHLEHGWSLGGVGWDMETRIEVLRDADGSDAPSGLRLVCERDAAGDHSPVCLRLARAWAARAPPPTSPASPTTSTPGEDLGKAAAAAAVGARAMMRRGLMSSIALTTARVFGLSRGDDEDEGGELHGGSSGRVVWADVSPASARIARTLLKGRRVDLQASLSWSPEGGDDARSSSSSSSNACGAGEGGGGDALSSGKCTSGSGAKAHKGIKEGLWGVVSRALHLTREVDAEARWVSSGAAIDPSTVPHEFRSLAASVSLVEPAKYIPAVPLRFLWRDWLGPHHTLLPRLLRVNLTEEVRDAKLAAGGAPLSSSNSSATTVAAGTLTPHWIGHVDLRVILDTEAFPRDAVPPHVAPFLRVVGWPQGGAAPSAPPPPSSGDARRRAYMPVLAANPVRPARDRMTPLNVSVSGLPLRLTLAPVSAGVWRLMSMMDASITTQHEFGATERDTDDLIRLLSDTPGWLLGLTFAVSFLHLLFESLALKSDVAFWAGARSFRGISVRSLGAQLLSNIIVTAFLVREGSSLLVTVPQGLSAALIAWKMLRAAGCTLSFTWGIVPRIGYDAALAATATEGASARYDAEAVNFMFALLTPLVLGASLRSLFFDRHVSWLDWSLSLAVSGVYSFGFALMTPAVYINYKLKSVAHLPWNVLLYRFLNTIIDDLFASLVKMPLIARVSVFRDDVIFVIYMVQRRMYAVDTSRPVEGFEEGGEGEGQGTE